MIFSTSSISNFLGLHAYVKFRLKTRSGEEEYWRLDYGSEGVTLSRLERKCITTCMGIIRIENISSFWGHSICGLLPYNYDYNTDGVDPRSLIDVINKRLSPDNEYSVYYNNCQLFTKDILKQCSRAKMKPNHFIKEHSCHKED